MYTFNNMYFDSTFKNDSILNNVRNNDILK